MSAALYDRRLYWCGMRGVAKLHELVVRLTQPPQLPGIRGLVVDAIDYTPEVQVRMVMPKCSGWRDMTAEEAAAAEQVLEQLVRGAEA